MGEPKVTNELRGARVVHRLDGVLLRLDPTDDLLQERAQLVLSPLELVLRDGDAMRPRPRRHPLRAPGPGRLERCRELSAVNAPYSHVRDGAESAEERPHGVELHRSDPHFQLSSSFAVCLTQL